MLSIGSSFTTLVWWTIHNYIHLEFDRPQALRMTTKLSIATKLSRWVVSIAKSNKQELTLELSNDNDNVRCTLLSMH
jgi:hypothetical protein